LYGCFLKTLQGGHQADGQKPAKRFWALKPVTFHYKSDSKATPQFGLIAEEVATVDPNLVVRAKNGEIYTEATNGD